MYLFIALLFIIVMASASVWLLINSFSMLQAVRGGAFYVPTPPHVIKTLLRYVSPTPDQLLIDIGSGDGRVLRHAAQTYGTETIGYEITWWPRIEAWLRNQLLFVTHPHLREKITTLSIPANQADLSRADHVFLYTSPQLSQQLADKLRNELPPHATIIALTFPLPGWQATVSGNVHGMKFWIYRTII